jgi:hypothetical protein
LREEHRLRVFEDRLLRIFGHKGRKMDRGENCMMINFTACILHAWGRGEAFTGFWLGG